MLFFIKTLLKGTYLRLKLLLFVEELLVCILERLKSFLLFVELCEDFCKLILYITVLRKRGLSQATPGFFRTYRECPSHGHLAEVYKHNPYTRK